MHVLKKIAFTLLLCSFTILIVADQDIIKPAVGDVAPEISMKNPDGETITLSSLRGKVVLVDIWASWCRTCRVENKTIRHSYNKYKNSKFSVGDGFEVFSVSLDSDPKAWARAIANDNLEWESHVSDFKKWDSPIVTSYNFRYLPHNVLIDQDGKILAKGLFGTQLEEKLASLLAE